MKMGYEMKDDFGSVSPEDSELWLMLFYLAEKKSRDLCDRLQYIRNCGSKLVPNEKFGYVIKPVISPFAWKSQRQYEEERKCLNKYKDDVVKLLAALAERS